jgi:hypothetical protein
MLNAIKLIAIAALTALFLSCAATHYPPPPAKESPVSMQKADSLALSAYDEYFLELYGEILEELERKHKEDDQNARLIEARSIVKIAEAVYLEGNTILAIKLLNDAKPLLRQTP